MDLLLQVKMALNRNPVEAGVCHEVEGLIEQAIQHHGPSPVLNQVAGVIEDGPDGLAASLLLCMSRVDQPGTPRWAAGLIRTALSSESVAVRDAAVQAAEVWAGPSTLNILEAHSEERGWLADYLADVTDDMSKEST